MGAVSRGATNRSPVLAIALGVLTASGLGAVRAGDPEDAPRTAGFFRAHWDYPAKASVGFGVVAARMPASFECQSACLYQGLTVHGAAGLGGGELALGYGRLAAESGRTHWLLQRTYVGYGLRAALVRTWGSSTLEPQGATFLGVEAAMTVAQFGLRLGVFHDIGGSPEAVGWRIFGGAGWGF